MGGEARAASIMIKVSWTGGTNGSITFTGTSQSLVLSAAQLAVLNGATNLGSTGYRMESLSGTSNNPGTATQGNLVLTGELDAVGNTTGETVTVTETESNFSSPTGNNAMLVSSSSATFTNQPTPSGYDNNTITSMYNATPTPTYVVNSGMNGITTNPNSQGNQASVSLGTTSGFYTLTNNSLFKLTSGTTGNPVKDQFTTSATVTAQPTVPEPASVVMLLTAMPLPVVFGRWLRRRNAGVQG